MPEYDFSAGICPLETADDLDAAAMDVFQEKWAEKSDRQRIMNLSTGQLLRVAEPSRMKKSPMQH